MFFCSKIIWLNYRFNEAEIQDNYFAYQPGGTSITFVGIERADQRLATEEIDMKIFCNFTVLTLK